MLRTREVALGGPIHWKGVMILSAFLGGRYALDYPLSLHGSVVFEQSYSAVEGDSASVAEGGIRDCRQRTSGRRAHSS